MNTTRLKNYIHFFLVFLTVHLHAQTLGLDWEYKEPEGIGEFIKVDNQGNIIVVGATDYYSSLGDYARIKIIKQDKNGNVIWQQTYVDSVTTYKDRAFDVELDTFDNIYIVGRTNWDSNLPPPDFSQSIILKYDAHGSLIWVRKWGNNLGMGGGAKRMKIFQNKYIYIAGYMDAWLSGYRNSFVLQYDSSGILNWMDTTNFSYDNFFVDIESDKQGNAYAIGVTSCCLPGFDTRVIKYDLLGNKRWSKLITDSIHLYIYPKDAVIDDSANVFVGGDTKKITGPNDYDLFMAKIDSSGNQKWWTPYASTNNSNWENVVGVVSDYNNDCYLYGYILPYGSGGLITGLITKMTKNGTVDWSWNFDTLNGGERGFFYDAILTKDSSIVFGGGGKSFNSPQPGCLAVSFKPNGIKKWMYENPCECYFNSIIEKDSSLYAAGYDFVPFFANTDSLYICKLTYDSSSNVQSLELVTPLRVYPNPFNKEILIDYKSTGKLVTFRLYNILGELIQSSETASSYYSIRTTNLQSGVYIVEIKDWNEKYHRTKLVKN